MLNKIIGILIILLLQNLLAEEYGLAEVLKMAEANNKTIQLARADLKTAAAEVKGAYSAALPKLDVNLGYNRNFKESKFFFTVTDTSGREITQSFRTSFTNQYQANAVLRQTLLSLQVGYGIQAARYFRR
ncbi:MAG: TolC family protein, partial [Calditrichaeota bacterium]|nr:TolC family protein [Calditrichota bacterium]